ncbi:MAG: hypothetical protein AMS26_11520 [Bacteroides sp. SM23_62]|nr:MAG: hypothetical protein AMS26_11520 [Bacteroides sp. SM23_62]
MIRTLLSICLIAGLSLLMACVTVIDASNKGTAPTTIQGIWTIEEMEVGIGENKRATVPQAFMLFIGEQYYSAIRDFSQEPRPDWGVGSPEEGSAASVMGFMADAGKYEYDGSTFVVHHQVAMIPNLMHGGSMTFGCQTEGPNTLILTPQYDKMIIPGMQMAPSPDGKMAYGDMAVRYKFKRLE